MRDTAAPYWQSWCGGILVSATGSRESVSEYDPMDVSRAGQESFTMHLKGDLTDSGIFRGFHFVGNLGFAYLLGWNSDEVFPGRGHTPLEFRIQVEQSAV
jgi:hypothetical protein